MNQGSQDKETDEEALKRVDRLIEAAVKSKPEEKGASMERPAPPSTDRDRERKRFCSQCGRGLIAQSRFCDKCGRRV